MVNYCCVTNSLEALQLETTIVFAYDSLGVARRLSQGCRHLADLLRHSGLG